MLKRILVVGFCIGLMGCDDDAIVYPPDVKETVATELKNTVWKPTYAASNESGTHKQESLSQAYIQEIKFEDNVVVVTERSGTVTRYGYDVSNANNSTSFPDPVQLNVKTNYANLYLTLPRDYSNMEMYLRIKEKEALFYEARYKK